MPQLFSYIKPDGWKRDLDRIARQCVRGRGGDGDQFIQEQWDTICRQISELATSCDESEDDYRQLLKDDVAERRI
jgi:hypothetical protein